MRLYLWLLLLLALAVAGAGRARRHPDGGARGPTVFRLPGEAWLFGRPFTVGSVLHLGVVALALALWRLSLDVGRVLLFRDDLHVTRRAAWRAVRLVLRAPGSVALYTVLGVLATLAVLLVARGSGAVFPEGNAGLALLALGVGQGVVWIRLAFQVAGTPLRRAPGGANAFTPPRVAHLLCPRVAQR